MLTDSNNLLINLLTTATNNTFLQTSTAMANTETMLASPITGADNIAVSTLWNQQKGSFAYQNLDFLLQYSGLLNVGTVPNLLPDYSTLLKTLHLQLLIQQEQQRQEMAVKQLKNMENLFSLVKSINQPLMSNNFSKESNFLADSSFPILTQCDYLSGQENLNLAQQISPEYINRSKIIAGSSKSVECSSASTSRDSTPPTQSINFDVYQQKEESKINKDCSQSLGKRKRDGTDETEISRSSSSRSSLISCNNKTKNSLEITEEAPSKKKSKLLKKRLQRQDNVTNSPVSGMFIKENCTVDELQKAAELDDTASYVHVSDEARKKIAEISDVIGDSICALCKVKYEDVFRLAMHRCPRIVHEEYRCPECEKMFSCPANLASHRRWHKPRSNGINEKEGKTSNKLANITDTQRKSLKISCAKCHEIFTSKKLLKNHTKSCALLISTNTIEDNSGVTSAMIITQMAQSTTTGVLDSSDMVEKCYLTATIENEDRNAASTTDHSNESINAAANALISLSTIPSSPVCVV